MSDMQNRAASVDFPAPGQVAWRPLSVAGAHGELAARLFTPAGGSGDGLIVFFPGGGFIADELDDACPFLQLLAARTGWLVLGSSYTPASVCPFPAAVEDAHAVLRWAARNKRKLGWSGKRLVSAGIESGGNLAAVSALMARDRGGPALSGQMLVMPMLDPGLTSCSMRKIDHRAAEKAADACAQGYRGYLPRALDRIHPYACPMQSSRTRGLPPALILSAEDDPLRDEAEQYGGKLQDAGIATRITRLPALALDQPQARCSCARKDTALREMANFIAGLESVAQGKLA